MVLLRRNHRLDVEFQQVLVDPLGAVALVPGERDRPGDRLTIVGLSSSIDELKAKYQSI